jgi:hypothetical protein
MEERVSTTTAVDLLQISDIQIERAVADRLVRDLHAVLYIQKDQVFWYHTSFPDFMADTGRSSFTFSGQTCQYTVPQTQQQ